MYINHLAISICFHFVHFDLRRKKKCGKVSKNRERKACFLLVFLISSSCEFNRHLSAFLLVLQKFYISLKLLTYQPIFLVRSNSPSPPFPLLDRISDELIHTRKIAANILSWYSIALSIFFLSELNRLNVASCY